MLLVNGRWMLELRKTLKPLGQKAAWMLTYQVSEKVREFHKGDFLC